NPSVFDIWMRLLHEIGGSVLWLQAASETAMRNLWREAQQRGIAPERLLFARRTERFDDHLARLQLADLFLDTLPYNAHSTASDALWAGVPVLSCLGSTYAGRVAASLLTAIGLPELVANSPEEYEARALELARSPSSLSEIRCRLKQNRVSSP